MQSRTRTLAPHLGAFVVAAEKRYRLALELRQAAKGSEINVPFTVAGDTYRRLPTKGGAGTNSYVLKGGQIKRIDTEWFVTNTFMTWTFVEVLRHTGIRVEEMAELTHLSIRQYRKPDGTARIVSSSNAEWRQCNSRALVC